MKTNLSTRLTGLALVQTSTQAVLLLLSAATMWLSVPAASAADERCASCGQEVSVSDDHPGMAATRKAVFGAVPWERCQFHLQQDAQAYVPRLDQRAEVARATEKAGA
jgi:hypothetical protein